jgi:hypothetical protein
VSEKTPDGPGAAPDILPSLPRQWEAEASATHQGAAYGNGLRDCARELRDLLDKGADGLAAALAEVIAERDKLQQACQTLGTVVERLARDRYASWIDASRGDMDAVRQGVLNSMPDVDDNEPDEQWNGTETGSEWFWRTRDAGRADAQP